MRLNWVYEPGVRGHVRIAEVCFFHVEVEVPRRSIGLLTE